MDELIHMKDVSFSYGQKEALKNFNLRIERGNFYGIVGPNGCGKTTLLDILVRNKEPLSGTVGFLGKDIKRYSRRLLSRHIALVPQDFYVNFPFTVHEVVMMGRHPYIQRFSTPSPEDLELVERVMEQMELLDFRDKYVTSLSGGEKQRVVFARALAQDTDLLLLDEGTSNMDIKHTLKALDTVLEKVEGENRTVVAVMHSLNLAATFCNKMVFMKDGQAVKIGDTNDVLNEENIKEIFEVDSKVFFHPYSNSKQVIFRHGR